MNASTLGTQIHSEPPRSPSSRIGLAMGAVHQMLGPSCLSSCQVPTQAFDTQGQPKPEVGRGDGGRAKQCHKPQTEHCTKCIVTVLRLTGPARPNKLLRLPSSSTKQEKHRTGVDPKQAGGNRLGATAWGQHGSWDAGEN